MAAALKQCKKKGWMEGDNNDRAACSKSTEVSTANQQSFVGDGDQRDCEKGNEQHDIKRENEQLDGEIDDLEELFSALLKEDAASRSGLEEKQPTCNAIQRRRQPIQRNMKKEEAVGEAEASQAKWKAWNSNGSLLRPLAVRFILPASQFIGLLGHRCC
jgi:hypothetical protein